MASKYLHSFAKTIALLWLALVLVACGVAQDTGDGGVGEDGSGVAPPATVVGVLKGLSDGTVTVNGVVFDQTQALITDGFGNPLTREQLKLGMWLQVEGSVNDTGTKGEATRIKVRLAVRGTVAACGPGGSSVKVLGSTANIGANIVFDGVTLPSEIEVGDVVEVHGALGGTAGQITASRVELIEKATNPRFELRGKVSLLDPLARTMVVGKQAVRYDGAQLGLINNKLADGQTVRVSSSAPPLDGQPWAVQRLTSDQNLPQKVAFFYAEGITSQWAAGPLFSLEDVRVDATTASGRDQITGNDLNAAAFGTLENGTLLAKAVSVITPGQPVTFSLSGSINRFDAVTAFQIRGVWVDAAAAQFVSGDASQLAKGRKIIVEGALRGRVLVASKIEFVP